MKRVEKMGKVVLVTAELKPAFVYPHDGRIIRNIVRRDAHRAGWVTGFSWLCEGNKVMGGDMAGCVLEETKRIPCMLVAYWPTMRPVKVPLDGYEYPTDVVPESPSAREWRLYEEQQPLYAKAARACYREDADLPRDDRGRWMVERSG